MYIIQFSLYIRNFLLKNSLMKLVLVVLYNGNEAVSLGGGELTKLSGFL